MADVDKDPPYFGASHQDQGGKTKPMMRLGTPDTDMWHDLSEAAELCDLDVHFGRFMQGLARTGIPELGLAAALLTRDTREGHICLDLNRAGGSLPACPPEDKAPFPLPAPHVWADKLLKSGVVGRPGEVKPLILDPRLRLYLFRYWKYQHHLVRAIHQRIVSERPLDIPLLNQGLDRLFPAQGPDEQKAAARTALTKRFSVISGGPGTGKTTVISKIVTLFMEQTGPEDLRIALAAPTGKAAARMAAAIRNAKTGLECTDHIKAHIPETASTLHRLLGTIPGSPYFRHHENNPLSIDLLVVDEASMIDLALMSKLMQALPSHAGIILLGDKDQLASVEAGAVFADICDAALGLPDPEGSQEREGNLTGAAAAGQMPAQEDEKKPATGRWLTQLTRNYRFGETSGIGILSRAVRAGDPALASRVLQEGNYADITYQEVVQPGALIHVLKRPVLEGFHDYLHRSDPDAPARFDRFRILCALREGPFGAVAVNALVEQLLARAGLIAPGTPWYTGRPVMITRNDYHLRLFNGDVGIILPDPQGGEGVRAVFPGEGGALRAIHPLRLPPHETVFAMTVHKSQGSEFDQVLFVLPDRDSPVLSRELIYTAVTRARHRLDLIGNAPVFSTAISRQIERTSGLKDALWGL